MVSGKYQPRKTFDQTELEELSESIKVNGVLQPILVRPLTNSAKSYEIIAGERRWRACQIAKIHSVPVIVRNFDDETAMGVAMIENLQRSDLNIIEEAEGYRTMMNNFQFTQNINWTKSIRTDQDKDILWRGLRKSYKSPINKGIKKQSFLLIDASNLDRKKFKLIQELHLKISGRKTRSDRTWDLQYDSIKNDNGFALLEV